MNKKMIFFDIDGTLISESTHILPQSAADAIRKARENGHLAFINTGRTYFNIEDELRSIGFDGYVCGCGTYVYINETPVFSRTIPHDTCVEIIEMLRECRICSLFEENDRVFYDSAAPITEKLYALRDLFGISAVDVNDCLADPNLHFDKLITWRTKQSDYDRFYEYITRDFDYIDRGGILAEIVPKGFSKATGIKFLQDYYHIPLENCYAIGDSTNDLPMLQYVPNSIAMGSSMQEILPYCSYQTTDLLEDGIKNALEHFGII